MLSVCRQSFSSSLQRISIRCVHSVVPEYKPEADLPQNEPILDYLKGSRERTELEGELKKVSATVEDVPIIIGNEEFRTDQVKYQVMPHNHQHKIAKFYYATPALIEKAIKVATETQKTWDRTPMSDRFVIWERAADLMANEHRQKLNATTMLGQSKTAYQAEIDSAAELIDFFRFNLYFLKEALQYQPISTTPKIFKNSMRYRGVDGFMAAVAPFNFTAIGGNLAYTPALIGNAMLWKPSDTAILSNYTIFKICREAGVPPGVVNFLPADGPTFGKAITQSPHLAGINFTGSVPTFNWLWRAVGNNLDKYVNFPKMIGECGGKNYHFVHPSADVESVVNHTIRSAFEFCGQKCSACSRMYAPESLWPQIKDGLISKRNTLKIDDPTKYDTFTGAVIDATAFKRIKSYIDFAKAGNGLEIVAGGKCDDSKGYFIEPTIIFTKDPHTKSMTEEIFGPVLTVYVYKDKDVNSAVDLVGTSTSFALTGAVFAQDEKFLKDSLETLKMTAGNFYINDKSTGSVVGQQPFGGARMSGTNDKAGGPTYVLRFGNPQTIKESFVPQKEIFYPYMLQP
ncbi:delta-1-pyrroline-5-carboxylate dehydrogenase, mitochondrial [Agrilus planipennis]|uniref:Multifunctional fusion protein n=1 Tax=Agrilus planipennis TaxID=224129 RepID=A0A1W4XT86_AGRPL|nr:delta-1-pyrroline-5-carboxylate dehydrogenase, mitochondrial [Agrilus planipennis]